jgi:uncharacterized protein
MPDLLADLRAYVGREAEPPIVARDPVNPAMVRAWCDAVGDANPIYTDEDAAARSSHGELVAPPTMIQAWFFPAVGTNRFTSDTTFGELVTRLVAEGYGSVVATNVEHVYARYCRMGERLTLRSVIDSVSDEKTTALGTGFFVDVVSTVTSDTGDEVCRMRYRRLYFRGARAGEDDDQGEI